MEDLRPRTVTRGGAEAAEGSRPPGPRAALPGRCLPPPPHGRVLNPTCREAPCSVLSRKRGYVRQSLLLSFPTGMLGAGLAAETGGSLSTETEAGSVGQARGCRPLHIFKRTAAGPWPSLFDGEASELPGPS